MRILIAAIALAGLAACSSTSTSMLDSRTALVSGKGGTMSDPSAITSSTMREAAEQALKRDYTHFEVVQAAEAASFVSQRPKDGFEPDACAGNANCRAAGGSTWSGEAFKPQTDLLVRFMTAEEADGRENTYDAQEVLAANL